MTIRTTGTMLALALALLPSVASAERGAERWPERGGRCITSQSQCAASGSQAPGTLCHCPQNPTVWGTIDIGTSGDPLYPSLPPRRYERPALRNDDLDDGDDVLAGPRHHPRRYPQSGNEEDR